MALPRLLVWLRWVIGWLAPSIAVWAASPPNVALIVADDLGWSDLSLFGSDLHESPFLDQFAREGVRFDNAYAASPVCSPTRAALMTGLHPARIGMTIWRESAHNRGNRALLEPVALDALPLEYYTLAEAYRDSGYKTAHVGKWHLGPAESYPEAHGFQLNVGGTLWGAPQSFFYPFSNDYREYFSGWRYVPGLEPGQRGDYLTDRLTDKAIEFIDDHRDEPFFLNLWYHSVHTPIEGKPFLVEKYKRKIEATRPTIHTNPHMAAMVESLDANVGRVLNALEERDLSNNTIIVFTSDNGGFIGQCKLNRGMAVTSNAPLKSGKGSCYEGGVRVPLMLRGPGIGEGRLRHEMVYSCDLYSTLLNLSGLAERIPKQQDGVDLSPLLRDTSARIERDTLFFHYPHYYGTTTPVSAIRQGDWKLLEYFEDGRVELYNLSIDGSETTNLSVSRPEIARRLRERLQAWRTEIKAQLPERNPEKS